jgi:K+-transporting ATPase ATPase B chain
VKPAIVDAFRKLNPRDQLRNPVMFVVYAGSILTSILCVRAWLHPTPGGESAGFILAVTVWLWFTVLFANFAEALAEGRSSSRAALRGLKTTTMARVVRVGSGCAGCARAGRHRAARGHRTAQGRCRARRGRRHDPWRWRSHRGRGVGR